MAVQKPKNGIAKCRRKPNSNRLSCMPRELLTEILARVASESFTDFFNAKTTCKEFLEAASDDYIFKHASIDCFPVIPWKITDDASTFLDKCKKSENPESLFRQGMIDYFSTTLEKNSGLDYLKRATNKGHRVATYVYGIILACYDGELRQKGLKLLAKLVESKSSLIVNECREKDCWRDVGA
ncbi:conserved hypothetical protein [Ricinus communis]|uniref:F-box domain-containing protein n=1 Tax=Ricinus communis TaxID=3988 RepID=B9RMM6_RICCO|nr:conserved hypothetical protein [Ricinus communis]|eukprot:XP_002514995.1 putative F-box protein At1g67623 [Ricinus communis]